MSSGNVSNFLVHEPWAIHCYHCLQAEEMFTLVADHDKLFPSERAKIPECTTHDRKEHTIRMAVRTIIYDMILSNNKMKDFITQQQSEEERTALVSSS